MKKEMIISRFEKRKQYIKPHTAVIGEDEDCPLMAGSGDPKTIYIEDETVVNTYESTWDEKSTSTLGKSIEEAYSGIDANPAKQNGLWEDW